MAAQLGNMGLIYMIKKESKKALDLFRKCLKLSEKIHYTAGIQFATKNIDKLTQGKKS